MDSQGIKVLILYPPDATNKNNSLVYTTTSETVHVQFQNGATRAAAALHRRSLSLNYGRYIYLVRQNPSFLLLKVLVDLR